MFPGPVSEWNINQVQFGHWMQYYDMIFSADDRPDDYVISDNRLLDNWVEMKMKEIDEYRRGLKNKRKGIPTRSASQHQNVIYFDDEDDW